MREKPILFSGEMVKAILDDRKSMTRRIVKPQPHKHMIRVEVDGGIGSSWAKFYDAKPNALWPQTESIKCPYGAIGDRLWLRETHYKWTGCGSPPQSFNRDRCYSDHLEFEGMQRGCCLVTIPSIHMPRWASRINLEIIGIRIERVQGIKWIDAILEGIQDPYNAKIRTNNEHPHNPVYLFRQLWDSINVKRGYGWETNPWVWIVEFKLIKARLEKMK